MLVIIPILCVLLKEIARSSDIKNEEDSINSIIGIME